MDLINKYYFKGTIRLTGPLHIGGGLAEDIDTRSPIVRTPGGDPYIPGSSLKGVFRSFTEQVVNIIPGLKSCQLNEKNANICYSVGRGFENWKKDHSKYREEEAARELEHNLCDVCQVFGSPWKGARIFFADAYITEWAEVTQVRHGVVIDRDSEKNVEKLFYDFEVVPNDSKFGFNLTLENASPRDLGIVAVGLNEMISGLMQIGGNTSRGAGSFILEDPEFYSVDFTNRTQLLKYLKGTTPEEKMSSIENKEDVTIFLSNQINSLFAHGGA